MPLDDTLPPSRLPAIPAAAEIVRHFPSSFGFPVDVEGFDALPALERLSLVGARLPEPPEAVLLDRVLQLVPPALLRSVERIVIVHSRGTARLGGSRGRIVRLSAQEARVGEGDFRYGGGYSLFTTTVLHEIGHVVFEAGLTVRQQEQMYEEFMTFLNSQPSVPSGEPSDTGVEHHFIRHFLTVLLRHGEPPISSGIARRVLAALGLELRRR